MTQSGHREWENYWNEPRLAACMRNEEGNYGGVIGQEWHRFFTSLQKHSLVVDLATGNGAIALLALQASDTAGLDLQVCGVDAVDIDPARVLPQLAGQLQRINFIGNTQMEHLPFADRSVHAVSGQYALEYSDMDLTIAEIARVLADSGRLKFISHTTSSAVYAATLKQLQEISQLEGWDLTGRVQKMVQTEPGTSPHERAKRAFGRCACEAMHALDRAEGQNRVFLTQFLARLGEIYQHRHDQRKKKTLAELSDVDADLKAHQLRLESLRKAALNKPAIAACEQLLQRCGFCLQDSRSVREAPDRRPLGHCFEASLIH